MEARRDAVLEYFQRDASGSGRDTARLVMVMSMRVSMSVSVPVMMAAAAQEPCARDVHGQAKAGDRDRLAEVDRDRRKIRLTDS